MLAQIRCAVRLWFGRSLALTDRPWNIQKCPLLQALRQLGHGCTTLYPSSLPQSMLQCKIMRSKINLRPLNGRRHKIIELRLYVEHITSFLLQI